MKVYLVGYCDYSPDGDFPNTDTVPMYAETSLEKATPLYEKLSEDNYTGHNYIREAYIIEMETGVAGVKVLRGRINPMKSSVE